MSTVQFLCLQDDKCIYIIIKHLDIPILQIFFHLFFKSLIILPKSMTILSVRDSVKLNGILFTKISLCQFISSYPTFLYLILFTFIWLSLLSIYQSTYTHFILFFYLSQPVNNYISRIYNIDMRLWLVFRPKVKSQNFKYIFSRHTNLPKQS